MISRTSLMFVHSVVLEELKYICTYKRTHIYIFASDVKCDIVMTSPTPQDNQLVVANNLAQFGYGRLSSLLSVNKRNQKQGKNSCL